LDRADRKLRELSVRAVYLRKEIEGARVEGLRALHQGRIRCAQGECDVRVVGLRKRAGDVRVEDFGCDVWIGLNAS
jgi:hypothetical protein